MTSVLQAAEPSEVRERGAPLPRRTFAIISHPDAGKTTLTEKLLLVSGAIRLAGAVKARGDRRRTRSDWMAIERARGISVSSSVMSFEHRGLAFNLLDTPGHEDFSEDTYRTLTAVDSAVMVIDAAKGIEPQTRKLFEVCRLRDVPIITFVNKIDREGRDPFELLDEIEHTLALDVAPVTWPIGMGSDFHGCYDLRADRLLLPAESGAAAAGAAPAAGSTIRSSTSGSTARRSPRFREAAALALAACPAPDLERLPRGPPDAGLLRQRAQGLRRGRAARRARGRGAGAARRSRPSRVRSGRRSRRSPASSSRSRPTWTPTTATASRSCASARAASGAA